jgi:hypothetical protein
LRVNRGLPINGDSIPRPIRICCDSKATLTRIVAARCCHCGTPRVTSEQIRATFFESRVQLGLLGDQPRPFFSKEFQCNAVSGLPGVQVDADYTAGSPRHKACYGGFNHSALDATRAIVWPLICASPCARKRLLPVTAGDRQAFPTQEMVMPSDGKCLALIGRALLWFNRDQNSSRSYRRILVAERVRRQRLELAI